jgi:magnesium chelatase family protein
MADMNLSARAYDRILKVARTLEDLAGHDPVGPVEITEAIGFRNLDRQLRG